MDVNYISRNGNTYLSIKCSNESYTSEKDYEYKMLTGNKISVFLSCKKRNENEDLYYEYDTTGKISLRELSDRNPLSNEELSIIINALSMTREYICEYLLTSEGLLLDPKYIFYDRRNRQIQFCFYPWNDKDMFSEYSRFSEYLLSAINYDDKEVVRITYEIYADILNKDYDLKKYVKDDVLNKKKVQADNRYGDYNNSCVENIVTGRTASFAQNNVSDITGIYENRTGEIYESRPEPMYETRKGAISEPKTGAVKERKRMSLLSIVCIVLILLAATVFTTIFIIDKTIINAFAKNTRIVSFTSIVLSLLVYIPVMNIVDINRSRHKT